MTPAEEAVRSQIHSSGPLTFAAFMRLALYDPRVGYYARTTVPLGSTGDYFTSAELHPAFAALLGSQLVELWTVLGQPEPFVVHEAGPGTGLFARDLLDWLVASTPDLYQVLRYRLDEASGALRSRQAELLERAGHGSQVCWVNGLAGGRGLHCVLANELIDALPVHLIQREHGSLWELYVDEADGRLELVPGPPSTPALVSYFERLGFDPPSGCRYEVNLSALEWMAAVGASIERGLLLVLDYGYPAERLYIPSRQAGSLLCYYRHTLNSDPLARIGLQDITSHVDFTSLRVAGEAAGLDTLGLVSQRRLLCNLGLDDLTNAIRRAPIGAVDREANLRGLDALVDPDGLGRILALVQQRGLGDWTPVALRGAPTPRWPWRLPLSGPEHIRLPEPASLDSLSGFEDQWAELMTATTGDDPAPTEQPGDAGRLCGRDLGEN